MPQPIPSSVYTATARAAVATSVFDSDGHCDVAVIGAGFAGLSAALHLRERGVDVTVLEANEAGWGASGRNGGQVNPGLKFDPERLVAMFGPDLGMRMIALSYGAPGFTFDLAERLGIDCGVSRTGTLRAAIGPRFGAAVAQTAQQCERYGMPVQVLDAAGMAQATGTDRYHSGLLDPRGGHLHPLDFVRGLARAAMERGVKLHGQSRVVSIQRTRQGWVLRTEKTRLVAQKLLITTNAYADGLWPGLKRSLVPVYSSMTATEPLPEALARQILPGRHAVYESSHVTIYYRLDADNRLLMGGRGPQRPLKGDPRPIRYLQTYAERLWPQLRGIAWTSAWNGQLAITPDHLPHLQEPAEDLLIYYGCNGRGVALATAMGAQLARRLVGGRTALVDLPLTDIAPMRFHAFWPVGVYGAMLWGRLKDALEQRRG